MHNEPLKIIALTGNETEQGGEIFGLGNNGKLYVLGYDFERNEKGQILINRYGDPMIDYTKRKWIFSCDTPIDFEGFDCSKCEYKVYDLNEFKKHAKKHENPNQIP